VEIEAFLYREARLLDERQLLDWVELFAEDGEYLLYVREKVQRHPRGAERVAGSQLLFKDDKRFLRIRAERILETQLAHAEKPPSVTRRLISNVEVDDEGEVIKAHSNFVVYQARLDFDDFTFFGGRDDTLQRDGDHFRILRRLAVVDQFVLSRSLTILF
jgi:3-phenylpropionate/cinnamic acid dioxygenase small subunit